MEFDTKKWLEFNRKEPQFKADNAEERRCGFGATDMVALCGYQKNRTPSMVLDEKRGIREPDDLSENWHVKWGIYDEESIRKAYYDMHNRTVYIDNRTHWHGFIYCHIDGYLKKDASEIGIEIKSREGFMKHQYGEEGTDQVLKSEMIQIQTMILCSPYKRFDLLVRCGKEPLRVYHIDADYSIQRHIVNVADTALTHLQEGTYPEGINGKDTDYIFREGGQQKQNFKISTKNTEEEIEMLKSLTESKKEIDKKMEIHKNKLKQYIGEDYGIKDKDGNTRAVWFHRKKGRAFIPYFNLPSGE